MVTSSFCNNSIEYLRLEENRQETRSKRNCTALPLSDRWSPGSG